MPAPPATTKRFESDAPVWAAKPKPKPAPGAPVPSSARRDDTPLSVYFHTFLCISAMALWAIGWFHFDGGETVFFFIVGMVPVMVDIFMLNFEIEIIVSHAAEGSLLGRINGFCLACLGLITVLPAFWCAFFGLAHFQAGGNLFRGLGLLLAAGGLATTGVGMCVVGYLMAMNPKRLLEFKQRHSQL